MVQQKQSVVTPERFAQGYSFAAYLDIVEKNRARFVKTVVDFLEVGQQ